MMRDISFEEKVCSIDWTKYLEPEYYDPEKMSYKPDRTIKALIQLSQYNGSEAETDSGFGSEIRFAIGND